MAASGSDLSASSYGGAARDVGPQKGNGWAPVAADGFSTIWVTGMAYTDMSINSFLMFFVGMYGCHLM